MSKLRIPGAIAAAFVVSQTLAVLGHGFVLAADYAPFQGTLLRAEAAAPMLLLPVVHLLFITTLVWVASRLRVGGATLARGLTLGVVGWGMGQAPLWLLWYAEQPWPGGLVVKQLGLELVSSLMIGITIASILRLPVTAVPPSVPRVVA